ncbi:hypothetical protein [Gracilibacillus kekensis]|nr:hypothetical protein [Gracilibacillus kekensis]
MKLNNRLKKDHQMTEAELKDIKRHNAKYLLKNKLNHTETD